MRQEWRVPQLYASQILVGIFWRGEGEPVLRVGLAAADDGDDFEAIAPF